MTKQKRREWWVERRSRAPSTPRDAVYAWPEPSEFRPQDYIHTREVLPDDLDPEWVDELIQLCKQLNEANTIDNLGLGLVMLNAHLAKRGEK